MPEKRIYLAEHGEGEFLARSPGLMRGYYGNEAATQATVEDGWLRTGDVGRLDRDDNVFLTGRAKSVIVLDSGEKVYPDELEERFQESALIRDACVISRPPSPAQPARRPEVRAVVCPDPEALQTLARQTGEQLTSEAARRWVQEEVERAQSDLARFKRVAEVVLTDEPLPRTELRKFRRSLIGDEYDFNLERLLRRESSV